MRTIENVIFPLVRTPDGGYSEWLLPILLRLHERPTPLLLRSLRSDWMRDHKSARILGILERGFKLFESAMLRLTPV